MALNSEFNEFNEFKWIKHVVQLNWFQFEKEKKKPGRISPKLDFPFWPHFRHGAAFIRRFLHAPIFIRFYSIAALFSPAISNPCKKREQGAWLRPFLILPPPTPPPHPPSAPCEFGANFSRSPRVAIFRLSVPIRSGQIPITRQIWNWIFVDGFEFRHFIQIFIFFNINFFLLGNFHFWFCGGSAVLNFSFPVRPHSSWPAVLIDIENSTENGKTIRRIMWEKKSRAGMAVSRARC